MRGASEKVRFADCEFDSQRFELWRGGSRVELSPKTLDLIAFLIQRRFDLVTRDELLEALWPGTRVNDGSLSNAIYEARSALGDDAQRQEIIQTVRGRGFRFVAPVEQTVPHAINGTPDMKASAPGGNASRSTIWIVGSLLVLALGPNAVLGYVNWLYNSTQSIPEWMRSDFDLLVDIYNPVSFSVGAVCLVLLARKPIQALRLVERGEGKASLGARQRMLILGHAAASLSIGLWVAAGIIYPSVLHAMTGGVRAEGTLHFMGSLVLCGLAAAAYPFFLITLFSLRTFYPALRQGSDERREDAATLLWLRKLAGLYLMVAGGIPLASIALLAMVGSGERWLLALVSLLGVVGLGAAFVMYRSLVSSLDALDPVGSNEPGGISDFSQRG